MLQGSSPVLARFSCNHSRPSLVHTGCLAKATCSHIITPSQCPVSTAFLGLFPLRLPARTYMAAEYHFPHFFRPPNREHPIQLQQSSASFVVCIPASFIGLALFHERRVWPFTTILPKVMVVCCLDANAKIRIARAATVIAWPVLHTRV